MRNNIKPIISNPRGHRIHSPFAYKLVSEVIFRQEKKDWFLFKPKIQVKSDKKQIYNLISRLVDYLKPDRIVILGKKPGDNGFQLDGIPTVRLTDISAVHKEYFPAGGDFVIWLEGPSTPVNLPGLDTGNVWFLHGLKETGMYDFFEKLKSLGNVRQTFELNSCGIIIFNPEFQKEDFVIKGKKSY